MSTDVSVPPHESELAPWVFRRRVRGFDAYPAAVPPLISQLEFEVDPRTAALCREAIVRITELEAGAGASLIAIEPFLVRTEAVASSRIEEEITTVDQIARAEAGRKASATARTVHGAGRALLRLIAGAEDGPLDLLDLLSAHRPLMAGDPAEAGFAGSLREMQNWIGGTGAHPLTAAYVPPVPSRVPELIDDLLAFMARKDLEPILQAAIMHAQFESIHPFTDGNGRIGRALINALLRYRGVTRRISVPVAAALSAERDRYFDALIQYRSGRAGTIIETIAAGLADSAAQALESARILEQYPATWLDRLQPRAGSASLLLLKQLVAHPIVDVDTVESLTGASTAAAYRALTRLEEAGVLRRLGQSQRDAVWGAADILDEADRLLSRIASQEAGA